MGSLVDGIIPIHACLSSGRWKAARQAALVAVIITLVVPSGTFLSAQEFDAAALAEEICRKLDAYPKYENWTFRSISVTRQMTKNWTPKKIIILEKRIQISGRTIAEEILRATEEEGGRIKDITRERIKRAADRKRRTDKVRTVEERKGIQQGERSEGVYSLGMEQIFPFRGKKRSLYDFILLEESEVGGRPALTLKSSAKSKDEDLLEGVYYIDKETLDVFRANLRPSKMPRMVKEFSGEIDFEVLPSGHFVLKDIRIKVNGGIFIKRVRAEIEESYKDYEILN